MCLQGTQAEWLYLTLILEIQSQTQDPGEPPGPCLEQGLMERRGERWPAEEKEACRRVY